MTNQANQSANIILITIDTVRPDYLGCYGFQPTPSPVLDKLAAESTLYSQAISNGPYTAAAFPPILTSTYPSMHGGPFADVGRRKTALSGLLKDAGYQTAGITSNPLIGEVSGYHHGFDYFAEPVPKKPDNWFKWKGMQRLLRKAGFQKGLKTLGIDGHPPKVYVKGDVITDMAINWLVRQDGKFFIWIHYMDAHWPYHPYEVLQSPEDYAQAWADNVIMYRAYHAENPGEATMARIMDYYQKAIGYMDGQIGRLLAAAREKDAYDNCMVVVAADHGEEFFEHGVWQHGISKQMYDELIQVPFILKFPHQEKQFEISNQVSLMDIVPTVMDVIGLPVDKGMEGISLKPSASGEELPEVPVISEMVGQDWYCASVRVDGFKYIYNERALDAPELYDLNNDPREQKNVYDKYPDIAQKMELILEEHLKKIGKMSPEDGRDRWDYSAEFSDRLRDLGYIE